MSEGVAIDMGTPGAPAVDSEGKPLDPRLFVAMETAPTNVMKLARALSAMGDQPAADRMCSLAGVPPQHATFVEKHPVLLGVGIGVGISGLGLGLYFGGRALYRYYSNRNAMPQVTSAGKVLPMRKANA